MEGRRYAKLANGIEQSASTLLVQQQQALRQEQTEGTEEHMIHYLPAQQNACV